MNKGRLQFPTKSRKGLGGFPEGFPGGFHGFPGVSEKRQGESALSETLRFTVKGQKREGCPSAREYPYYNINTYHMARRCRAVSLYNRCGSSSRLLTGGLGWYFCLAIWPRKFNLGYLTV